MANTSLSGLIPKTTEAWLEDEKGDRTRLVSPFEFGRSPSCACQVRRAEASRVHAMLQFDSVRKLWWLSDLGSRNGTYRSGHRITKPVSMEDGDTITICSVTWTFRENRDTLETGSTIETHSLDGATLVSTESADCWLMLMDIVGSSMLSRSLPQDEFAEKLRDWMGKCTEFVLQHGGVVNEYLGDAVYAFWRTTETEDLGEKVADCITSLTGFRGISPFKFRVLVHHGSVQFGGGVSSGLESLVGSEVNFFFKAEKVLGAHPIFCGLTSAAAEKLGGLVRADPLGSHDIPGFPGDHELFAVIE